METEDKKLKAKQVSGDYGYIPDLVAGAGPGILSLLTGASPNIVSEQLQKGNQYAMNRGKQEEVTKDKLSVIDVNGEPMNVLSRDALGERPYMKSASSGQAGSSNSGNVQSTKTFSRKKDGELLEVYVARDGNVYRLGENASNGNPISPETLASEYVPFKGFASANLEDAYGNKSVTQMQRTLPSQKVNVAGTTGYGQMVGVPTEGVKQTEKSLDEHNKRVGDLELKTNDLKNSITILDNPSATPTELTAAREAIIRAISTEPRLTDEDVARAMGNDFRSFFAQARNMLGNKTFGEMNPKQRQEFLNTIKTLTNKMDIGIQRSYDKMIKESQTVPGGKEYLEKKTPDQTKKLKANKAELERIKQVAKKSFGKDKASYDLFIARKTRELGLD